MTDCKVCEHSGADKQKYGESFHKKCLRKIVKLAKKSEHADIKNFINSGEK